MEPKKTDSKPTYEQLQADFLAEARSRFSALQTEIANRNEMIEERDDFIYGDRLERSLDVPIGHDMTPVNWLRRTVEIHKNMFMSRGFQVISTYDTQDTDSAPNDEEKQRLSIENKKRKAFAEQRKNLIDAINEDNGGASLWSALAENASAVGTAGLKAWYNEAEDKYELSEIEAMENIYVLWNRDNFRGYDAIAFAYQVSKRDAIDKYGAPEDVATSPLGQPLEVMGSTRINPAQYSNQPMVTIFEVTGKIEGWGSDKGSIKKVDVGSENDLNFLAVGNKITRIVDDPKKLPKYYLFPNKRQRRRPWGASDISDAAININQTYVETLSDWRTVAAKVNFPKYKAYGFGADTQLPKSVPRKIQAIPLSDGQDMVPLDQGDANQVDFRAQMDELKEQFVRETGISRVLFDDPSVTLNSNQALLTSMKPTSDIAEAKKQLWAPIITQLFNDALETIALHKPEIKELVDDEEYSLKVMWPSLMQKEDPVFQQMLLNRKNAGVISVQSYLEAQGESKEELDRIREEMKDPITAAIHGNMLNMVAEQLIAPPSNENPAPKTTISLRGDLTPQQEANLAHQQGFNDGPFPPSMGPQGQQGRAAQENADNEGFLTGDAFNGGKPITRGPDGQPVGMQKSDKADGSQPNAQVATQANNQPGEGVMSQPGSGATTTSAQGALNQTQQNNGG